jgi:hypothetical protein
MQRVTDMAERRHITVRGYRRVFKFERRLFRFDRWRIPYPHGIPLRGIAYFVTLEFLMLLAARLPVFGALVAVWHPAIAFLAFPSGGAFALMQVRIDGRPPHHVLGSLMRHFLFPRCLAGLDSCPRAGEVVVPVDDVSVAYDARESFPVAGRIRGPARITCRYPSVVQVEGAPPWVRDREKRRSRARRYRIRQKPDAPPMLRGKTIRIPRGREVVVE